MSPALVVYVKEVRENLRDRRTLFSALLMGPLLGPMLFALIVNFTIARERATAEKPLSVPVLGAENAPNLVAALKQMGLKVRPPVADPGKAITDQTEDVILSIPPRYGEQWKKGDPAEVEIIFDSSRHDADSAMHRLSDMVSRVGQREASLRLFARGISPKVVVPITIANRDQATAQSRSQILFSMMPYLFIMSLFIGGMYLAIDTTAGERERQSLEPLFANPVSRTYILLGKVCATFTFSTMSLCISMGAFAIAARIMPIAELGMSFSIGPRFVGGVLLVMLPVVVLLGSMQTLVAAFAKSYREAQTYQSILLLLPALPSALFAALPLKAQLWMYAIPLIGQQLTVMRLVRGEGIDVQGALLCVACTSLAGLIAFAVTAVVYRSERLAISA